MSQASQQRRRSPVIGSSVETSTPTSSEVRKTAFTCAARIAIWPMRTGDRKLSWSIEAVTTGRRAWRIAAIAAARSVHCMTVPPKALPSALAWLGITSWVISTREAAGATGSMGP